MIVQSSKWNISEWSAATFSSALLWIWWDCWITAVSWVHFNTTVNTKWNVKNKPWEKQNNSELCLTSPSLSLNLKNHCWESTWQKVGQEATTYLLQLSWFRTVITKCHHRGGKNIFYIFKKKNLCVLVVEIPLKMNIFFTVFVKEYNTYRTELRTNVRSSKGGRRAEGSGGGREQQGQSLFCCLATKHHTGRQCCGCTGNEDVNSNIVERGFVRQLRKNTDDKSVGWQRWR